MGGVLLLFSFYFFIFLFEISTTGDLRGGFTIVPAWCSFSDLSWFLSTRVRQLTTTSKSNSKASETLFLPLQTIALT